MRGDASTPSIRLYDMVLIILFRHKPSTIYFGSFIKGAVVDSCAVLYIRALDFVRIALLQRLAII